MSHFETRSRPISPVKVTPTATETPVLASSKDGYPTSPDKLTLKHPSNDSGSGKQRISQQSQSVSMFRGRWVTASVIQRLWQRQLVFQWLCFEKANPTIEVQTIASSVFSTALLEGCAMSDLVCIIPHMMTLLARRGSTTVVRYESSTSDCLCDLVRTINMSMEMRYATAAPEGSWSPRSHGAEPSLLAASFCTSNEFYVSNDHDVVMFSWVALGATFAEVADMAGLSESTCCSRVAEVLATVSLEDAVNALHH